MPSSPWIPEDAGMGAEMDSYVHGTSGTPLLGETIGAAFDRIADRHADREALVVCDQGVRLTYAELRHRVDVLAANLIARGLSPGERVDVLVSELDGRDGVELVDGGKT